MAGWQVPKNVDEQTKQLIDAGIAARMLGTANQVHLPTDPAICRFWVEAAPNHRVGPPYLQVIVQFPPNYHMQAFTAMRGASFGIAGDPPLSDTQMAVVERLAPVA